VKVHHTTCVWTKTYHKTLGALAISCLTIERKIRNALELNSRSQNLTNPDSLCSRPKAHHAVHNTCVLHAKRSVDTVPWCLSSSDRVASNTALMGAETTRSIADSLRDQFRQMDPDQKT
jgi:hypothetical protein